MTLSVLLLMASLTVGLAVALLALAVPRIFAEVPRDERAYMDPPPRFYRMTWPLVLLIAHHVAPLLKPAYLQRTRQALRRAGQDYALTAVQFFAGKLVAALCGALAGFLLADALAVSPFALALLVGLLAFFYPDLWLKERTQQRNLKILKGLPFFLDIVTLAVEAGLNLSAALQQAVERLPDGPLPQEINRVLRDVRAGRPRIEALRDMAERLDFGPITSLVSALVQGELMGSSLGPILRAQSEQRRSERFQRAEKLAMEAPVKMLGPLILCIFPCTFIVIGFPIVVKFLTSGI
ncbi:MAG: type II secretion system F family protein [Burkholderiaceae bacterium]|nr:type II secretion system F family protein [Burkholderiaceae bacterium]